MQKTPRRWTILVDPVRPYTLWSDLRTTHLLLSVGYRPHEMIKILMTCWSEVEISNSCLHHLGVGFWSPLLVCLDGKFSNNILPQKAENVEFLPGDLTQTPIS